MLTFLIAPLLLLPQDADRLIRDLADDDVVVRDAAQAELVKMGKEKAEPVLTRAAAHRDPEVRARARAVRRAFDRPPRRMEIGAAERRILLARFDSKLNAKRVQSSRRAPIPIQAIPAGPAPKAEDVRAWIRDLGSDSFVTREKASGELRKARKHVQPQLKKAAASRDREVAFRARSLLAALSRPVSGVLQEPELQNLHDH